MVDSKHHGSRHSATMVAPWWAQSTILSPRCLHGGLETPWCRHGGLKQRFGHAMVPPWRAQSAMVSPWYTSIVDSNHHGGLEAPRRLRVATLQLTWCLHGEFETPWCRHGVSVAPWHPNGASMASPWCLHGTRYRRYFVVGVVHGVTYHGETMAIDAKPPYIASKKKLRLKYGR